MDKARKSAWFYVAIIIGILAILTIAIIALSKNNILSPYLNVNSTTTNTAKLSLYAPVTTSNYNYIPNTNSNQIKGVYTYTISGINENNYLDRPNDIVTIVLSGINNVISVSSETEVSSIILSGNNNIINFCNGNYPIPSDIVQSGNNNQINPVNC